MVRNLSTGNLSSYSQSTVHIMQHPMNITKFMCEDQMILVLGDQEEKGVGRKGAICRQRSDLMDGVGQSGEKLSTYNALWYISCLSPHL